MRRPAVITTTLLAVAMLGIGMLPTSAQAQSHADLVWRQLNNHFTRESRDGYGSRNYIIGRMNDDASDSWTMSLPGGNTYKIIGACDADCSDLDIEIYEGEKVIVRDVLVDDVPIVTFNVASTSQIRIKVLMASCSADPCFFGIVVLYK
jgi:hypothetical protein